LFSPPGNIFELADALANFRELGYYFLFWVLLDADRRGRVLRFAGDAADNVLWLAPSTIILCGLLAPVGVAVAYTSQPLNQAIIAAFAIPLCWLWYGLSRMLDSADGYLYAAVAIALSLSLFGYIAYMPHI